MSSNQEADRLDLIVAAAVRQGWTVRQSRTAAWVFRKGTITVTARVTDARSLVYLVNTLKGAGLAFP